MTRSLAERARRIGERTAILRWEYRQRHHAKGTWFRLRRTLAGAAEAWSIDEADAARLIQAGHEPLPIGRELAPAKQIFVLEPELAATLSSRRCLAVRLDAELLQATAIVLVPFLRR